MGEKQLVLPLDFSLRIPEDSPVRLVDTIVDEMDCSVLNKLKSRRGRKYAVPPVILFKIYVYAALEGILTLRDIVHQCQVNVEYMWLLQEYHLTNPMTLNRFINRMDEETVNELFMEVLKGISKRDTINYDEIFIDGTKIEAMANCYSFVWKGTVKKFLKKKLQFQEQLRTQVAEALGIDTADMDAKELAEELRRYCHKEKIKFTSGIGHRKHPLQKLHDSCEETAAKIADYNEKLEILGDRNSYSKTDHDATFMRMKEDHMMNGQLKPAYNLQIASHAEYIMGLGIFPNPTDTRTLIPFLKDLEHMHERKFEHIVADAGYDSEENLTWLSANDYKSVIKPAKYERSKTKKFKSQIGIAENMQYDAVKDEYICAKGRKLTFRRISVKKNPNGFRREGRIYTCESCNRCGFRAECQKSRSEAGAKYNKTIFVADKYLALLADNKVRFDSDYGTQLRVNRSIQAEGVFGVLKADLHYKRTTRKGKKSVYVELMFIAMGYNLKKLHNKTKGNRIGQTLFALKQAS